MQRIGVIALWGVILALVAYSTVGHHTSGFGGYGFGSFGGYNTVVNRTVLCALRGGACITTTTSCVGTLKFSCENSALCCFNTTTLATVLVKKIIIGGGSRRSGYGSSRRRGYGRRW